AVPCSKRDNVRLGMAGIEILGWTFSALREVLDADWRAVVSGQSNIVLRSHENRPHLRLILRHHCRMIGEAHEISRPLVNHEFPSELSSQFTIRSYSRRQFSPSASSAFRRG